MKIFEYLMVIFFLILLGIRETRPIRFRFMSNYLKEEDKASPRASAIKQKDFSYLPPTLIVVAELDPLRDGCYGMLLNSMQMNEYSVLLKYFGQHARICPEKFLHCCLGKLNNFRKSII